MGSYILETSGMAAAFVFCGCIAVMYLAPCAVIALRRVFERAVDSPMRAGYFAIAVGIAVAYGGSKPANGYKIVFDPNVDGAPLATQEQFVEVGKVAKLDLCSFSPPSGKRFAGWRRQDNGRRYDDGIMVFNLAESGEVVVLEAIWE